MFWGYIFQIFGSFLSIIEQYFLLFVRLLAENPFKNLFENPLHFLLEILSCSKFCLLNRQILGVDGRDLR